MITVAIAEDDGEIAQHLGKSKAIHLYQVEDGKILKESILPCTEKGHEYMLALLKENKVQVLICNGLGKPVVEVLEKDKVALYPALVGDVHEAILEYLDGSLPKVSTERLFHSCCQEGGCHCHCCHEEE